MSPRAKVPGESSGRMFRRMLPAHHQERLGAAAAVASVVLRTPSLIRMALVLALAASLWLSPAAALAGETAPPTATDSGTVVFGLTATQFVIAVAVGAGTGAIAALASGNAIVGASLGFGTLGTIYVAHLAAEALVVGGVYYWWPWEPEPEAPATVIKHPTKDGRAGLPPLRLAPGG